MTQTSDALDAVKSIARRLFERQPLEAQPLMVALQHGELPPAQARALAIQIHHVVEHFPRMLAALAANVPDWQLRSSISENLWEEHGRGKAARVHAESHRRFVESIGVTAEELRGSRPAIPVIVYNRALRDLCFHHAYCEGLGALAVVEEVVARASTIVGRYAVAHLGLGAGRVEHFADHETLDVTHAQEFYELAATQMGEAHRAEIEQGMELGLYYHFRLYADLLQTVRN